MRAYVAVRESMHPSLQVKHLLCQSLLLLFEDALNVRTSAGACDGTCKSRQPTVSSSTRATLWNARSHTDTTPKVSAIYTNQCNNHRPSYTVKLQLQGHVSHLRLQDKLLSISRIAERTIVPGGFGISGLGEG